MKEKQQICKFYQNSHYFDTILRLPLDAISIKEATKLYRKIIFASTTKIGITFVSAKKGKNTSNILNCYFLS